MMLYKTLLAGVLSLQLATAFAHGDEDHGATPHQALNAAHLPEAQAQSADFELYAQLQGDTLIVYLDRYSDNQPIADARIEVDSAAFKGTLTPVAAGTYQVSAAALNHPGEHSLLFTVLAGEQSDLLDSVLRVSPGAPADHAPVSRLWWLAAAGGVLLMVLGGVWLRRRAFASHNNGATP